MSNNSIALFNTAKQNQKVTRENNLLGIKFRVEEIVRNNAHGINGSITETDVNDAVFCIFAERRVR